MNNQAGAHRSACLESLLCFFRKRRFSAAVILRGPFASVDASECTWPFATGATSAIMHPRLLDSCLKTMLPGRGRTPGEVLPPQVIVSHDMQRRIWVTDADLNTTTSGTAAHSKCMPACNFWILLHDLLLTSAPSSPLIILRSVLSRSR